MRPALLPRSLATVLSPANDPSSACAPHLRNVAVEAAVLPLPKPRARQSRDSSSFVRCPHVLARRHATAVVVRAGSQIPTTGMFGHWCRPRLCRGSTSVGRPLRIELLTPGRELASRASCKRRGSDARARAASSRSSAPRVEDSAPSRPRYIDPCGRCCRRGARLGRRER